MRNFNETVKVATPNSANVEPLLSFKYWPVISEAEDNRMVKSTTIVIRRSTKSLMDLPLVLIQKVLGKGNGLVARLDIAKGQRILIEKPIFTISNFSPDSQLDSHIAGKLKSLSKSEQRQFLSLHNNFPGKHVFSGIFKTNALPCGPDSVTGGVYPTICLINHSCLPNSHHSWNSDAKCETVHAIRDIKAGEEITISYDTGGPSDFRQEHLRASFGFSCNCSICSLPSLELQNSDTRRRQIQHLDNAIGNSDRVMNRPDECLADCRSLSRILEEEYRGSAIVLVARLYYDAFQISITHGDQARAKIFAQRGYEMRVICEGEDSPETQKMKGLMDKPTGHRNFGASQRWKTLQSLVPRKLGIAEFEGVVMAKTDLSQDSNG